MTRKRRTGRGPEIAEVPPDTCPACGHRRSRAGYLPCSCAGIDPPAGHRIWTCRQCGLEVYEPPHSAAAITETGRWQYGTEGRDSGMVGRSRAHSGKSVRFAAQPAKIGICAPSLW